MKLLNMKLFHIEYEIISYWIWNYFNMKLFTKFTSPTVLGNKYFHLPSFSILSKLKINVTHYFFIYTLNGLWIVYDFFPSEQQRWVAVTEIVMPIS